MHLLWGSICQEDPQHCRPGNTPYDVLSTSSPIFTNPGNGATLIVSDCHGRGEPVQFEGTCRLKTGNGVGRDELKRLESIVVDANAGPGLPELGRGLEDVHVQVTVLAEGVEERSACYAAACDCDANLVVRLRHRELIFRPMIDWGSTFALLLLASKKLGNGLAAIVFTGAVFDLDCQQQLRPWPTRLGVQLG